MLIDTGFKFGDVVSVKTTTGDELLGSYRGENSDGSIKLSKVRALGHGESGFVLMQYIFSVDPDEVININKDLVIVIAKTGKIFADNYSSQTSSIVL